MTGFKVTAATGTGPQVAAVVESTCQAVTEDLDGPADLAVAFFGSAYAGGAGALAERLAALARVSVGVTAQGVISGPREYERPDALTIWAASLPDVTMHALRYETPAASASDPPVTWPPPPQGAAGLLVFGDPYSFPAPHFLHWVDHEASGLPVSGGLASGARLAGGNRLLLDGAVHSDGAVAVALGGAVSLHLLVSQGCRPVGPTFTVTAAEGNLLRELAGRPAVDRVREIFLAAGPDDRELLRRGLLLGVLLDEHTEDPGTDFLVRGVLGVEPGTDGLVLGAMVEPGRTVRFHVRDAASADADLCALLSRVARRETAGGLLFACNGRGRGLFGYRDHDAQLVSAALGGAPLSGFFAAGEFGPVGGRSWLHGFTASLLVMEPARGNAEETGT
jgi:small ligand-binding sensory domain FIST